MVEHSQGAGGGSGGLPLCNCSLSPSRMSPSRWSSTACSESGTYRTLTWKKVLKGIDYGIWFVLVLYGTAVHSVLTLVAVEHSLKDRR